MKNKFKIAIISMSILGTIGCTNKAEEAKSLGFFNEKEMADALSKGFKTKSEYDIYLRQKEEDYQILAEQANQKGFANIEEMEKARNLGINNGRDYLLRMANLREDEIINKIKQIKANTNDLEKVLDHRSNSRIFTKFKNEGGLNKLNIFHETEIQSIDISYKNDGSFDYAIIKTVEIEFTEKNIEKLINTMSIACEIPQSRFIINSDDRSATAIGFNEKVKCSLFAKSGIRPFDISISTNKIPTSSYTQLNILEKYTGDWAENRNECTSNESQSRPENLVSISHNQSRLEYYFHDNSEQCLITGKNFTKPADSNAKDNFQEYWLEAACRAKDEIYFKNFSFRQRMILPSFDVNNNEILLTNKVLHRCPSNISKKLSNENYIHSAAQSRKISSRTQIVELKSAVETVEREIEFSYNKALLSGVYGFEKRFSIFQSPEGLIEAERLNIKIKTKLDSL